MPITIPDRLPGDPILDTDIDVLGDAIEDLDLRSAVMFDTFFDVPDLKYTSGVGAMFTNEGRLVRFRVDRPFAAAGVRLWCGAVNSGGFVDGNIFNKQGGVITRIAGASTPIAVAANMIQIPFASTINLLSNVDYWGAASCSSNSPTFLRHQSGSPAALNLIEDMITSKASTHPLPATWTAYSGHQNAFWMRIYGTYI